MDRKMIFTTELKPGDRVYDTPGKNASLLEVVELIDDTVSFKLVNKEPADGGYRLDENGHIRFSIKMAFHWYKPTV